MVTILINTVITIFFISIIGILALCRNFIILLMALEIMVSSSGFIFVIGSVITDDIQGQSFMFFLITLAAVESAFGLALLIKYYFIIDRQFLTISNLKG